MGNGKSKSTKSSVTNPETASDAVVNSDKAVRKMTREEKAALKQSIKKARAADKQRKKAEKQKKWEEKHERKKRKASSKSRSSSSASKGEIGREVANYHEKDLKTVGVGDAFKEVEQDKTQNDDDDVKLPSPLLHHKSLDDRKNGTVSSHSTDKKTRDDIGKDDNLSSEAGHILREEIEKLNEEEEQERRQKEQEEQERRQKEQEEQERRKREEEEEERRQKEKEEEEVRRQKEKEEEEERRRKEKEEEEEERRRKEKEEEEEEEERRQKEKKEEEEVRRQKEKEEEEERRRKEKEEEERRRKEQEEQERRRKEQEEQERRQREQEEQLRRRKEQEEQERRQREQEEQLRRRKEQEEQERRRKEQEEQERRQREQEEQERRRKEQEEQERKQKELESYKRQEGYNQASNEMDKQHKKEQVRQDEDVIISPFGAKLKKVGPNAQSNDISQALTLSNSQAYAKPTYNGVSNAENSFSTKTQPSDQIQSVKPLKLRNEFTGQSFPTHDADEDEYEELDPRAIEAARWVDKEIRKLIGEIQSILKFKSAIPARLGNSAASGIASISFGTLFVETANIFEALTGTLKTAKKYKVVDYEGEVLYQGSSDNVVITLLKDTHDGVEIKRRKKRQLRNPGQNAKSKGFSTSSLQNAQQKCHICTKTVYPMEFVGAADKAFHKNCFRCRECKTILKPTNYCTVDDQFFCQTHYTQLFMSGGYTHADQTSRETS
eukprot:gene3984-6439_t